MAAIRAAKSIIALLLARTPRPVSALWFAGRRKRYDGRVMDPKAQALGELTLTLRDPANPPTVPEMRQAYRDGRAVLDGPLPNLALKQDDTIPGPAGPISVRLYDAVEAALTPTLPRKTLVFLHGGGWVIGDLDTHDGACARLAVASGARVIAVDYRLAPEHKYPAAPDDVLAVHDWIERDGARLGLDATRLAYGGDSAGGNLTAVLMHDLSAAGRAMPRAQVLIYPATDIQMTGQIFEDLKEIYVLPKALCDFFRDTYTEEMTDLTAPRLSPQYSPHLAGQPAAFVVTAGFDVLRPQGEAYAEKLRMAGVDVTYEEASGEVHGFVNFNAVCAAGPQVLDQIGDWLKDRL